MIRRELIRAGTTRRTTRVPEHTHSPHQFHQRSDPNPPGSRPHRCASGMGAFVAKRRIEGPSRKPGLGKCCPPTAAFIEQIANATSAPRDS